MRMRRKTNYRDRSTSSTFTEEITQVIQDRGLKNAVCVLLGANNEIEVISANEDSVQLAGILDLGKTCLHNDVLGDED